MLAHHLLLPTENVFSFNILVSGKFFLFINVITHQLCLESQESLSLLLSPISLHEHMTLESHMDLCLQGHMFLVSFILGAYYTFILY